MGHEDQDKPVNGNDKKGPTLELRADKGQSLIRLDKFLADKMEKVSRSRIQDGINDGKVLVNGEVVKPNYRVRPEDFIEVALTRKYDSSTTPLSEPIPLDIIYEDEDLLVLNKQTNLVVHPAPGSPNGTLINGLLHYFNHSDLPIHAGNSVDRPGLVHRIDKNTTGLMVIAKTPEAMTHLAKQFYDHSIHRRYQCLVWGNLDEPKGSIEGHIGRDPSDRRRYVVFPEGETGKWAKTHYEVVEDFYYVSLVECQLETGRTHQIRVHMKHIGHPLFNDQKYGGDQILKGTIFSKYKQFVKNCLNMCPRQSLHAKELGFIHPRTGEKMFFDQPLPDDMADLITKWRTYVNNRRDQINAI